MVKLGNERLTFYEPPVGLSVVFLSLTYIYLKQAERYFRKQIVFCHFSFRLMKPCRTRCQHNAIYTDQQLLIPLCPQTVALVIYMIYEVFESPENGHALCVLAASTVVREA